LQEGAAQLRACTAARNSFFVFFRVRRRRIKAQEGRRRIMKRTLALALATFLGLALLSTSLSVAQDAIGGVTSWSGSYGTN
jgi:hypothetical protein